MKKIEFTYVLFEPRACHADAGYHGTFSWGAKDMGFGQVDIGWESGVQTLSTETMPRNFVKQMLNYWVKNATIK